MTCTSFPNALNNVNSSADVNILFSFKFRYQIIMTLRGSILDFVQSTYCVTNCLQNADSHGTLQYEHGTQLSQYVCLFVGCLMSQQHASVSQGRICSDNFTCCHTEIEAADQTFYLTKSQYTDTRPTIPSTDPIMPGTWQGSHWSANF